LPPKSTGGPDGWHGRVKAQKAHPDIIGLAAQKSIKRVRFGSIWFEIGVAANAPAKINRAMASEVNDTWASAAENASRNCPAGAKLRRVKSHERCRVAGR